MALIQLSSFLISNKLYSVTDLLLVLLLSTVLFAVIIWYYSIIDLFAFARLVELQQILCREFSESFRPG